MKISTNPTYEYAGEVGEYAGLVGEYAGDVGLRRNYTHTKVRGHQPVV